MSQVQQERSSSDVLSESITLVKNMIRISISSICHVRELFQQGIRTITIYTYYYNNY